MAGKITSSIVGIMLAASVTAGLCAGCSRAGGPAASSSDPVSDSASAAPSEFKEQGTVAGIDYTVYNKGHVGGKETSGYSFNITGDPDSGYFIVINAGERPSGGYTVNITDVYEDSTGQFVIKVEETTPDPKSMVTDALTYPYCSIKVSKLPDKLKVIDANGNEIKSADPLDMVQTVEPGYIAVFEDGAGEIMRKTYVYMTNSGYTFTNVEAVTESWGSPKWKETVISTGKVHSKNEIVSIAKDHGSCGFVMITNEDKPVTVEEFLERDF